MWAAAVDGWINVPGCESLTTDEGVLYMAPKADAAARPIPRLVAKSTIFSLTAWNPMGKDAPYACIFCPDSPMGCRLLIYQLFSLT